MAVRHVLVTGGAGYIGSVLTELLLDHDYRVTVLDRMFFGPTLRHLEDRPALRIVRADIRSCDPALFDGVDAVCDLAALSNDPAGELDPEKTHEINHRGRARVARLAKEHGVQRYVLASSCSVYGFQEGVLDETSGPQPLTTYAQANLQAEASNLPLASPDFCVTALRQATVYGLSKRMRFDLAINGMTLGLFQHGRIPVLRDGTQWRPMVHVRDTSRAFLAVLEAQPSRVNGQILNVGANEQNYQILELARRVAAGLGKAFEFDWYGSPDKRSYRVSFDKIRRSLEFTVQHTPEDAAREIGQALATGQTSADTRTRTVDWYKALQEWHAVLQGVVLDDRIL